MKATTAAIEHQFTPSHGFVSSVGRLTEIMSDTAIALVEGGALLRPRQFDMGDSE